MKRITNETYRWCKISASTSSRRRLPWCRLSSSWSRSYRRPWFQSRAWWSRPFWTQISWPRTLCWKQLCSCWRETPQTWTKQKKPFLLYVRCVSKSYKTTTATNMWRLRAWNSSLKSASRAERAERERKRVKIDVTLFFFQFSSLVFCSLLFFFRFLEGRKRRFCSGLSSETRSFFLLCVQTWFWPVGRKKQRKNVFFLILYKDS